MTRPVRPGTPVTTEATTLEATLAPARRARWTGILPPAGLALLAVVLAVVTLDWPAGTLDEMILVVYPERMMAGDLPYRDFFTAYGPAQWWLLQAVYSVTEPSVLTARTVGIAVHVGLVLAVYWLVLPRGRGIAAACSAIAAFLLLGLGAAPFAWLTCVALCVAHLASLHNGARLRVALGGVLAGLAIAVRPDVAPLAMLPALPFLWRRLPLARWWATGLGIGLTPLGIGLVMAGPDLLRNVFGARAGKGAGQSRLPFWPDGATPRQLLLLLLVAVLLSWVVALQVRSRHSVALAVLATAALPQALQRADTVHFVYAGLLSVPLLPLAMHDLLRRRYGARAARGGIVAGAALVALATPGWVAVPLADELTGKGPRSTVVEHDGRKLPVTPSSADTLRELLQVLDREGEPGQTVFVYDGNLVRPAISDVGLYHLLPSLTQRAYNLEITPGVTSFPGGRLREDLWEADVVVLLDISEEFRRALFPHARDGSTEAREELERSFCRVATVDYYVVYRRCAPRQ